MHYLICRILYAHNWMFSKLETENKTFIIKEEFKVGATDQ